MFFASNLVSIPPMGVRYFWLAPIPLMGVPYFWLDPKVSKRSRLTLLAYSVHCVRCARLKPFAPLTSTALRTLSPFSPFYGHQRMPGFLSFSSLIFPSLFFLSSFSPASASLSLSSSLPLLSRAIGVCRSNNTYYNGAAIISILL